MILAYPDISCPVLSTQSLEFSSRPYRGYREIGGVAHRHRYDNLKSVVLERSPELKFNAQFLDSRDIMGSPFIPAILPGQRESEGGEGDPGYPRFPPGQSLRELRT